MPTPPHPSPWASDRASRSAVVLTTTLGPSDARHAAIAAWTALAVILLGSYAVTVNTTVIGVALPAVAADLGTSGAIEIDWVVTSFLLGVVAVQPATGWLADRWGRAPVYTCGLGVFSAAALGCAVAPSIVALVSVRFAQGLGGGILLPVGMTIIYEAFPAHRRGLALGVWGVGIAAAPAAGPPLGGWLITEFGWRWLFAVMTVAALVATVASAAILPDSGERRPRPLDGVGWALAAASVVGGVIATRQAVSWGWSSPATLALGMLSAASMWAFVRRCRVRDDALIDLGIFRSRGFLVVLAVTVPLSVTQFARLNFLPVELQVIRELSAREAGLVLAPGAIGVAVAMPISGWLVDRVGPRLPAVLGLVTVAATMVVLGSIDDGITTSRIAAILVVQGLGTALAYVPTTVGAMSTVDAEHAAPASALQNLTRQLAGAVGVAAFGALLVSRIGAVAPLNPEAGPAQEAYNLVFLMAGAVAAIGALASMLLPATASPASDSTQQE